MHTDCMQVAVRLFPVSEWRRQSPFAAEYGSDARDEDEIAAELKRAAAATGLLAHV